MFAKAIFFLQSQKKIVNIVILFLIVAAIPLTVLIARQQQNTQQKAAEKNEEELSLQAEKPATYAPGEIIVKFKTDTTLSQAFERGNTQSVPFQEINQQAAPSTLQEINNKYHITNIEKVFPEKKITRTQNTTQQESTIPKLALETKRLDNELSRVYKLTIDKNASLENAIQDLTNDPNIAYAEPNYLYHIESEPNDPYYLDSYPNNVGNRDLNWNPPHDYQWNIKKTNSMNNWQIDTSSIIVAVIDTGVDVTHPDLGNIWTNPNEIPNNNLDDDNNGCFDDIHGCQFVSGLNGNIEDDNNHGTHVAGVISGKTNNQLGLAGITNNTRIMAVKPIRENGFGRADDVALAVIYATDNGARVINMSLGGVESKTFREAMNYAVSKNVIIVVAAGNGNSYSPTVFPASYKQAITVGGVEEELHKMRYANYGPNIDVAAPGGGKPCMYHSKPSYCSNILSLKSSQNTNDQDLVVGEKYLRYSGTSMATPHVAGIVALLLAQHPTWGLVEVENYIRFNSIDPEEKGHNEQTGWGVINSVGTTIIAPSNIDFVVNYPAENSLVGSKFVVAGTIKADNFDHFEVAYRLENTAQWITNGITLENGRSQVAPGTQRIAGKAATITFPANTPRGIYEIKTTLFMTNGKSLVSTKTVHYMVKPDTTWFNEENDVPPKSGEILIADLNNNGTKEIILYESTTLRVFDNRYNLLWEKEITEGNDKKGKVVIGNVDRRSPGKEVIWAMQKYNWEGTSILVFDANGNQINDITISPGGTIEENYLVLDADKNDIDELYFFGPGGLNCYEQNSQNQFVKKWNYVTNSSIPTSNGKYFVGKSPIGGNITGDELKNIVINIGKGIQILDNQGKLVAESPVISVDGMVLADLDQDGKEEIITHSQWGDTKMFKYNNGALTPVWSYNSSGNVMSLSIGDFDNDSYPDVYLLIGGDGIPAPAHVLNYKGELVFVDKTPPLYFSLSSFGSTTLADKNNDGKTEIYQLGNVGSDSRTYFNTLEYDYSTSDGVTYPNDDWKAVLPKWSSIENSNFYGSYNPLYPLAATDLDNNGKIDLVIGGLGIVEYEEQGKIYWPYRYHDYQRTNSYNFVEENTPTPTPTPAAFVCNACGADTNKDGRVSVVDYSLMVSCYDQQAVGRCTNADINTTGQIDIEDIGCVIIQFGETCSQ